MERAFQEVVGPAQATCPTCLGPYRGRNVLPSVVIEKGEEVPTCPECGELTYQDGRTAVPMGQTTPPVVVLAETVSAGLGDPSEALDDLIAERGEHGLGA